VLNLLRYRCQPHQLLGQIPLAADLQLLAIATSNGRPEAREKAREVLDAGAMGLRIIETVYRDLGQQPNTEGYLGNISPGLYRRYFRTLLARRIRGRDFVRTYGDLPGREIDLDRVYHMRAAVDHLIGEGEFGEHFLQMMEDLAPNVAEPVTGSARILSARRAGRLLSASQHSYRLRLGLSSPNADWLIARLTDAPSGRCAYGARVTEIGDGLLVVVLAPNSDMATDHLLGVISEYGRVFGARPRVYRTGAPGGAGTLLNG
jgi:galactokinase